MMVRRLGALPQLSQEHCDSAWSLLNPVAWFGGCVARDVANVYERARYGQIPRPDQLPQAPIVGLPKADGLPAIDADDWAAWKLSYTEALQAKEDDGTWDPTSSVFDFAVIAIGVVLVLRLTK